MWSRKPTPVSRSPAPVAVERRASTRTSVSPVLRSICGRCGSSSRPLSRMRASIDCACSSKPSARAIGAAGAGQLGGAVADPHLGEAAAEVRGGQPGGEARRAVGRQDVVGAGDVVAERGRRRRRRRTGSRRACTRGASASAPAPTSSRCSGANASASASACVEVGGLDEPRDRAGLRRAASSARCERVEQLARPARRATTSAARRRARPGRAGRARASSSVGVAGRRSTSRSLGPGEAVDPDVARRPGAWPPARTGCPGRRSRRPRATVSVP